MNDTCPEISELQSFSNGRVDEPRMSLLAQHIEDCETCCRLLDSLNSTETTHSPNDIQELLAEPEFVHFMAETDEFSFRRNFIRQRSIAGPAPTVLGRYQVESELGRGSFGCVYLCEDPLLKRRVAIKVAQRGCFETVAQANNFVNEARHAAALDHPGIVPILDVIDDAKLGTLIVMKWIDGATLKREVRRQKFDALQVVRIMADVAQAVHHAHEHGMVHRDLKPSNILLDRSGTPHVVDFGLVVDIERDGCEVDCAGTPPYMAPEQLNHKPELIGRVTDIWALGMILAELLTGVRPFSKGPRSELYQRIRHDEPELDSSVPSELRDIVMQCLAKRTEQRLASADILAERLTNWLRQSGHAEQPRLARRRVFMTVAVFAAMSVVIGAFKGFATPVNDQPIDPSPVSTSTTSAIPELMNSPPKNVPIASANEQQREPIHEAELSEAAQILEQAKRAELKALEIQYAINMRLASSVHEQGDVYRANSLLNQMKPTAGQPDVRGSEWYYMKHRLQPTHSSFNFVGLEPQTIRYSRDGRCLAIGGPAIVQVIDAKTRATMFAVSDFDAEFRSVAFSPDGKWLAGTGNGGAVSVWDVETKRRRHHWKAFNDTGWSVVFTEDSRQVAACSADKVTKIWEIASGELVREIPQAGSFRSALAMSPNGKVMAAVTEAAPEQRGFGLWDTTTGTQLSWLATDAVRCLDFSPDSRFLAMGQRDKQVLIYDVSDPTQTPRRILQRGNWSGTRSVRFSPDQSLLAAVDDQGEAHLWELSSEWWSDPNQPVKQHHWLAHPAGGRCVEFTPDGKSVVTSGTEAGVCFWRIDDIRADEASVSELFVGSNGDAEFVPYEWSFSDTHSNGAALVVASVEGLKIWNHETKQVLQWIHQAVPDAAGKSTVRYAVAVSASGRVATVRDDHTLEVWERDPSGKPSPRPIWTQPSNGTRHLALSTDGRWLVSLESSLKQLRVFDLVSKSESWTIDGENMTIVNFMRGKPEIVTYRDNKLERWDIERKELLLTYPVGLSRRELFAISPSQRFVAAALNDRSVVVCEADTGRIVNQFSIGPDQLSSIALLADDRTVLVVDEHAKPHFWRIHTGEVVAQMPRFRFAAERFHQSADGQMLLFKGSCVASMSDPSFMLLRRLKQD